MIKSLLLWCGIGISAILPATAQQLSEKDRVAKAHFLKEQQQISKLFNTYFNQNINQLYGADESLFIRKIDSLRQTFIRPLDSLRQANPGIGAGFYTEQYIDLGYTFDKFILDYIPVHKRITGKVISLSSATKSRLASVPVNNPSLLQYDAYVKYLNALLEQGLEHELLVNRNLYAKSNNQRLDAGLKLVSKLFKDLAIRKRMEAELLIYHLENYGVKDIDRQVAEFGLRGRSNPLWHKVDSLYQDGISARKNHAIEVYKTVAHTKLDLHIFGPEDKNNAHPVIVFFHGGGWSEGMPDWFFSTCEDYAKKGWVAVAVEYRLRNRQGALPPQAIADGKSAIRYLRKHANRFKADPDRIVVSGNSAGANLALATALIDTLDEKNENLNISSVPNAVMLNSVATDFTHGDFWQQYYTKKAFLTRISPLHQIRGNLPPILILQGDRDYNVPFQPVRDFAEKMKALGNDCELQILEGAGHFIWYDRRFSTQVTNYRQAFLKRLGYPN